MQKLLNNLKVEKRDHLIVVVLFIMYLLLDIRMPRMLSKVVDTIYGRIILYLFAIHLFLNVNKAVGILAVFVAYTMINRASKQTGNFAIRNYLPSEEKKVMDFSKFNDFPYSLEEEEVSRMAPLIVNHTSTGSNFKPVLDALHDAAPADYEGVI